MPKPCRAAILIALAAAVVCAGCVTTTAHRLPLAQNPLRREAKACEAACRGPDELYPRPNAAQDYARCLDSCPGATATDGDRCPTSSTDDLICEETTRANPGAIAGGTVAVIALGVFLVLLSGFATLIHDTTPGR